MPTLTETYINDLKINKPTRTQLENATTLSSDELYFEDPEFFGGKLLATDSNGDIVESAIDPTDVGTVTSVNNVSPENGNVTIPNMTGADGSNAGSAGLVPAPSATDNTKFLRGDGSWAVAENSVVLTDIAQEGTAIEFADSAVTNYTVVGSPIISTDYVASGFSTRNAVTPNVKFSFSTPWEFSCKITTGADVVTRQKLNGCVDDMDYRFPSLEISRPGYERKIFMCVSNNGYSWDIVDKSFGSFEASANTTYWLKFRWTGSDYYYEYSTDGIAFTREYAEAEYGNFQAWDSNLYMGIGNDMWNSNDSAPFLGSIDLKECYFVSDGVEIWRAAEVDENSQSINVKVASSVDSTSTNDEVVGAKLFYDSLTTITALSATDSITLSDNYCYQGGEQTSLTIALPESATVGFVSQVSFLSGTTATAITYPSIGLVWHHRGDDVSGGVFTPVANKVYTIMFIYDGYQFIAFVEGTSYVS